MKTATATNIETALGVGAAPSRRRIVRRWLVWSAALLVIAGAGLGWGLQRRETPVQYRTQPASRGAIVVTVSATGNLAATNEVEVGSELSGIVKTVAADYNDRVQVGQPLAYLDSTKFEAAVMKSRAALHAAQAGLAQAKATLTEKQKLLTRQYKTRELTGGKMPSLEDVEAAEAALARARAEVSAAAAAIEEAEAQLKSDETNLAKTVIVSPVNGIVLDRNVEPGQTVAASLQAPVLFTLAEDLTRMELQVDVDEADVGQVQAGQSAVFTVDAYPEKTFEARITQVRFGAQTTDNVVTYKTVLNVANPDLLLRPGMTATADITVQKLEDVLRVPNAALRFAPPQAAKSAASRGLIGSLLPGPPRRASRPQSSAKVDSHRQRVWILEQGRPVPAQIETGASDGAFTAVTGGDLTAGQEVIVGTAETAS